MSQVFIPIRDDEILKVTCESHLSSSKFSDARNSPGQLSSVYHQYRSTTFEIEMAGKQCIPVSLLWIIIDISR